MKRSYYSTVTLVWKSPKRKASPGNPPCSFSIRPLPSPRLSRQRTRSWKEATDNLVFDAQIAALCREHGVDASPGSRQVGLEPYAFSLTVPDDGFIFTLMGEYLERELDALFFSLSHRTRRNMMRHLSRSGETRVTELARSYRLSLNTVSKHIKVLERARLVRRTVHGREHHIRLDPDRLLDVERWLRYYRRFWSVRLEHLAGLFDEKRMEDWNG